VFADTARFRQVAALDSASIDRVPFALLLVAHHAAGTTGMLVARRGPLEKRVLLSAGTPIDCRSNLVHETLSRFLVSIGRLSRDEETVLLARSSAEGRLFGQILLQAGRIDEADLHKVMQQNLAKKLLDLFTWRDGEIAVERGEIPSSSALRVRVPQLVLTGITRFMPREGLERAIAPLAGRPLVRGDLLTAERSTLRLGERERRLLAQLETPRRFEELLVSGAGRPAEVARSLLALALLGGVLPAPEPAPTAAVAAKAPRPPAAPPTPRATPPPAAPPPLVEPFAAAGSAPPPAAEAIAPTPAGASFDEIRTLYETFRDRDPFDLLGVDEVATAREIDRRFVEFSRAFAPWPWRESGRGDVADRVTEIFLAGVLAYAKLLDADAFEGLLRARRERRAEADRPAAGHDFRIETDLLDADAQFKKGLAFKQAGKLDLAQQQLDFAADCDPQNGLYLAEAAHCRFRLAPSTNAARALEELVDAQRVDPACAEACLYAGEIAAHLGRLAEAEEHDRQAARLLGPQDRRALDALRELGQRKRKQR
jgi:hypothetical protein